MASWLSGSLSEVILISIIFQRIVVSIYFCRIKFVVVYVRQKGRLRPGLWGMDAAEDVCNCSQ